MSPRAVMDLTADLVARAHRSVPASVLPPYVVMRASEDHAADVAHILGSRPAHSPLWLFAYGSLLWLPAVDHAEERPALAMGWHRAFCMQLRSHRATVDQPGLMMALDNGGKCNGIALRLAEDTLEVELGKLIRREVPVKRLDGQPIHVARWIAVRSGGEQFRALAFVINRKGPSYAGKVAAPQAAALLADACGSAGSCAEYLYNTVVQLEARGIRDRNLWHLQKLVADRLAARDSGT